MRHIGQFRFLLFQFDSFYPLGGLNDLKGTFRSIEDALEHAKANKSDSVQVFDSQSNQLAIDARWLTLFPDQTKDDAKPRPVLVDVDDIVCPVVERLKSR